MKKLFIIEFGRPNGERYSLYGSDTHDPVYVVANSYDHAAAKAIDYVESKPKENSSVLDSDGSLKLNKEPVQIVKNIKLASDEVVW